MNNRQKATAMVPVVVAARWFDKAKSAVQDVRREIERDLEDREVQS